MSKEEIEELKKDERRTKEIIGEQLKYFLEIEREDVKDLLRYSKQKDKIVDKLQKENESLNKKNKRYEKYLKNKDIEHEKVLEYIETEKEHDYISKDKVRTKIKELEEYITGKRSSYKHLSIDEALIVLHTLKELLGDDE